MLPAGLRTLIPETKAGEDVRHRHAKPAGIYWLTPGKSSFDQMAKLRIIYRFVGAE